MNHHIIHVPDPAVLRSFLQSSFSKRCRKRYARVGSVSRKMCTIMYSAESRWMPIFFEPARDKVVVTGNCIPLLEILIFQIVLSDPRSMSKLKRIELCWKDYHPRNRVGWDSLDNIRIDFNAVSNLIYHLPSLETIDFYASKQVLQWNAWDSKPRRLNYKRAAAVREKDASNDF